MKRATMVQPIRKTGLPAGLAAGAEPAAGLIADSLSANTRRAYRGALARLDAAVEGGTLNDEGAGCLHRHPGTGRPQPG